MKIADMFTVSPAWARMIKQRRRQTGETTPHLMGEATVIKIDRARPAELVREQPDATLKELRQRQGRRLRLGLLQAAGCFGTEGPRGRRPLGHVQALRRRIARRHQRLQLRRVHRLLRPHPRKLFSAAIWGGPPTDWREYDSIYTERYMLTPQENPEGYDKTSVVRGAGNLVGRLMLVHGTIDDNVHPANSWKLAKALQDSGKQFEMAM